MSCPQVHRLTAVAVAVRVAALVIGASACAPLPRLASISVRQADYFAAKPELSSRVARAMEDGHVLLDRDTTQVWVVLGDPVRKTKFDRAAVQVWLYRAASLHQDHYKLGPGMVRLTFLKNRLVVIEPM